MLNYIVFINLERRLHKMIIIGFPGIGKSSFCKKPEGLFCIDMESSNFEINGFKIENWAKIYARIIKDLCYQGYIVFSSSHLEVREELKNYDREIYVCYPTKELKSEWIKKLEDRYSETGLDKDLKSLNAVKEHYDEMIESMENSEFGKIVITDIDYNLENLLKKILD